MDSRYFKPEVSQFAGKAPETVDLKTWAQELADLGPYPLPLVIAELQRLQSRRTPAKTDVDPRPRETALKDIGNFGWALEQLKLGGAVTRKGWNGPGQCIRLQWPTPVSKMHLPYLFIRTVQGKLVPWVASQTDLLADDWMLA